MKRFILVHYGEIGLKNENKDYFVEKLKKRIKLVFEKKFKRTFKVRYTLGRILVELEGKFIEDKYAEVLDKIFGIKNYQFVFAGSTDIKKLGMQIFKKLPKDKVGSFCVRVKRAMDLDYKSIVAEREIGAILIENGFEVKVKMKDPELLVSVELFNDCGYFSFKKYVGAGGFPPNSQSKLVCLMSSGIDSPVAAYKMMRRGARIIFVGCHGYPIVPEDEMEQIKDLVGILSEYQADTKLYLIPFGQIQKEIYENRDVPAKIRTVLYRRMMLMIAEMISRKEGAKGIITGDNYGQVASQTPDNLFAIHEASSIPVYQPLIGYEKEEIIEIARKIGTFEISKLPCRESCTMFAPKSPELSANIYDLNKIEEKLPVQEWGERVFGVAEIICY